MIYVEKEYPTTDVYTAEGELFGSYERLYPYPDSGIVLQSTVEGVCVYDENMKLVSTLVTADYNDRYEAVDGTSEMLLRTFAVTEGDALVNRYCVIDLSGKALSREYERILQVYPQGYLSVMEGEEKRIVDFEGNTMVSGFYAAHYDEAGYFVVKVQDEGYYVYDRAGKKINETAMANVTNGLIFADNAGNVLVLETGEMLASDGFHKARMGSLVLIADTLYDVITGKAVLTGIDSCGAVGDSLYIWDDETETYTRYIAAYKSKD